MTTWRGNVPQLGSVALGGLSMVEDGGEQLGGPFFGGRGDFHVGDGQQGPMPRPDGALERAKWHQTGEWSQGWKK